MDNLEVRKGNNSDAPLVGHFDHTNLSDYEMRSHDGFYIRLKATCANAKQFNAVYVTYTNGTIGMNL